MSNKNLFVTLILASFILPSPLKICLADPKSDMDMANDYYRKKDYTKAEAIYQSVIRKTPGSGFAGRAMKKLSLIDIALNRTTQMQSNVNEPESDLPQELNIQNKKISNIGREYKKAQDINKVGMLSKLYNLTEDAQAKKKTDILRHEAKKSAALLKYRDTKSVYQAIVDNKPGTDEAFRALTYIAILEIAAGNDSAANAASNKLFADFAYHDNILKTMYMLARKYVDVEKHDKAKEIYQLIDSRYSGHPQGDKALRAIPKDEIIQLIDSNDFAGANSKIEQMTNVYSTHDNLPATLLSIAVKYREKGFKNGADENAFLSSAAICEAIIQNYPDYKSIASANFCAGDCYSQLGDFAKALDNYEGVIVNNPEYESAWYAYFMVARMTEILKSQGVISKEEADLKIKATYEKILADYPDCKAAKAAQSWLDKNLD